MNASLLRLAVPIFFALVAVTFTGLALGACAELAEYPPAPVHVVPIAAAKNVNKWIALDAARLECADALRAPGSNAGPDAKPLRSDAAMVPVSGAFGVAVIAVELHEPCATLATNHAAPPTGILIPARPDVVAAAERQSIRRPGDLAPVFELCTHCGPASARARSRRDLFIAFVAFLIAAPLGLRELRRRAAS